MLWHLLLALEVPALTAVHLGLVELRQWGALPWALMMQRRMTPCVFQQATVQAKRVRRTWHRKVPPPVHAMIWPAVVQVTWQAACPEPWTTKQAMALPTLWMPAAVLPWWQEVVAIAAEVMWLEPLMDSRLALMEMGPWNPDGRSR